MGAGRPKGSTSRNGEFLLSRLKDMLGDDFDPFVTMAEKAKNKDDPDQMQALKEICQYIKPKLKSVDMTVDAQHTIKPSELTPDAAKAVKDELESKY